MNHDVAMLKSETDKHLIYIRSIWRYTEDNMECLSHVSSSDKYSLHFAISQVCEEAFIALRMNIVVITSREDTGEAVYVRYYRPFLTTVEADERPFACLKEAARMRQKEREARDEKKLAL